MGNNCLLSAKLKICCGKSEKYLCFKAFLADILCLGSNLRHSSANSSPKPIDDNFGKA